MKIYDNISQKLDNTVLILGFFDGLHSGHRKVIKSAVEYAKMNNSQTILLTFNKSPAEYFQKKYEYIYSREFNYQIIKKLGVDYIISEEFENLANISAKDYVDIIVKKYAPKAIFSGFNYTFGKNKNGDSNLLQKYSQEFNYNFFSINPIKISEETVSSTLIKSYLKKGELIKANELLGEKFSIISKVVHGLELGRKLGFPTANLNYPENIIKLPYGVYKGYAMNKPAVINWGIKPTLGGSSEVIEVHILNYNENLYDKFLEVKFEKILRNEKKFDNLDDLKKQIKKDIEECLK